MELQPPTAPLPPFFAALRRRHPGVDVVVLPEDAGAADPTTDLLDDAALEAAAADAGAVVAGLTGADADTRLTYAGEVGTVRVRSRGTVEAADDGALTSLRDRLAADGWQVRRLEGAPRLVARREAGTDLHLRASYAPSRGVVLVEVTTGALPVGDQRAKQLVRP